MSLLKSVDVSENLHKAFQEASKDYRGPGIAASSVEAFFSSIELIAGLVVFIFSAIAVQSLKFCGAKLPESIESLPESAARHTLTGLFSLIYSVVNVITFTGYSHLRPRNGFSSIPFFL